MAQYALLMFILVFLSAYLVIALSHLYTRAMAQHRDKYRNRKIQYWLDLIAVCRRQHNYAVKKEQLQKLKNTEYLSAFEEALNLISQKDIECFFKANEKSFVECAGKLHNEMLQAYIAYIISKLGLHGNAEYLLIENLLMHYLLNHSTYLRENVLLAFYNLGKADVICEAYRKLSERNVNHNEKLVCDGLLRFSGNRQELAKALTDVFDELLECYQVAIINYLRLSNDKRYDDKFRTYLNVETTSVNVQCAIIRLLARSRNDNNRNAILKALNQQNNNGEWEVAAVAATSLGGYKDRAVLESLTNALHSPSWYVRVNSAKILAGMDAQKEYIGRILTGNDQYAKDALQYELRLKGRFAG